MYIQTIKVINRQNALIVFDYGSKERNNNGCNFILRIMKSKQVLSIEQMKHLQELGLDTSDASMYWKRVSHGSRIDDNQKVNGF